MTSRSFTIYNNEMQYDVRIRGGHTNEMVGRATVCAAVNIENRPANT